MLASSEGNPFANEWEWGSIRNGHGILERGKIVILEIKRDHQQDAGTCPEERGGGQFIEKDTMVVGLDKQ